MSNYSERLRVFISSRMTELADLRAILRRELERLGIDAFVYEAVRGAHPDDPERVSLDEVAQTDLFVLVIGDSYGEITEREYDRARELKLPCLVYERLNTVRHDDRLERFLSKLSGPRGVPSRTSFRNAADLIEQVARDVQSWLVREYRRLSARQMSNTESSRRAAQLQDNIRRLAASSSSPLPSGNSSDILAWQLRQWFEALEYPIDTEPTSASNYIDMLVRVPARRRHFQRTLVRCVDGEIRTPEVSNADKELADRSLDEIWLVSLRRISPAARDAAKSNPAILLYTLDELIEEDVDFGAYFEWLDREVCSSGIPTKYVPLAVMANEIEATGKIQARSNHDDIGTFVDQWLADTDGEHLSLLGEFGTGKSWFALKYAYDMIGRYRDAQKRGLPRPRIPLVVKLRDYARGFKDVGSLLTEFVFREHKINIRSFAVLETLNRMGRLLFIFDGFDEMAARVDQQKMVDNFWSLAAVLGPGSKAILTCRTEYFRFAKQARDVLSGEIRSGSQADALDTARFQVATLQMLDEDRLKKVLFCRTNDERLVETVLANHRLVDLGRRPVMIDLLIEAIPNLQAETADLAQVYFQAVRRKMERDIKRGSTFTSLADKMYFMCELSWEMLATKKLKMHFKEIPERVHAYFGADSAQSSEIDYWRHDLLSQTMLVRDEDGYYHPAHKSLVEFFSAYKLAALVGVLKDEYVEAAKKRVQANARLEPTEQCWSDYFHSVRGSSSGSPLARFTVDAADVLESTWGQLSVDNAISDMILLLGGERPLVSLAKAEYGIGSHISARLLEVAAFRDDLRGADLSGACLNNCRLFGTDLGNADLTGSNWNQCRFDFVSFEMADLSQACFDGSTFDHVCFQGANLSNSRFESKVTFKVGVTGAAWCTRGNEELLIAILEDGRVAAVSPLALNASCLKLPIEGPVLTSAEQQIEWLLGLTSNYNFPEIGTVSFSGAYWRCLRAWHNLPLADGITSDFSFQSYASGDVEAAVIKVTDASGNTIFNRHFADAVDRGSSGTRALAISMSGTLLITVCATNSNAQETAKLMRPDESQDVMIENFSGKVFGVGAETMDTRGAAFSPNESILAICETNSSIGFWRTENGQFLGRIKFGPFSSNCIVDGSVGLPPTFEASRSADNEGWIFEAPV